MAAPARADFLSASPTNEGTRVSTGSPAVLALQPGPLTMLNVSVNGGGPVIDQSIVEFDLGAVSTLPHGALISSAVLSLHVAGAQTGAVPGSFTVGGYQDGDGLVGLGDFVKALTPLGGSGPLANAAAGSESVPLAFDVTGFIQTLANNRGPFVGFRLDGPSADAAVQVWGSLAPDPAERPVLSIIFAAVPEPAGAVLMGLGLGLAGLAALGCRRRVAGGQWPVTAGRADPSARHCCSLATDRSLERV
jgi:hypothetical protein